jgi:hypothetical protein
MTSKVKALPGMISGLPFFRLRLGKPGYDLRDRVSTAFVSDEGGRDIQQTLIDHVGNFVSDAAGKRFNPHVTIGVGTETYLNEMEEPFPSFTFSAAGASVYQLGSFGTARKELTALTATP